jgi:GH43 family beta-xylosidase
VKCAYCHLDRTAGRSCIHKHGDGWYYFTASVPATTASSCAGRTIAGLAEASTVMVWRKPTSALQRPDLGAGDPLQPRLVCILRRRASREIKNGLFQHRMYAISTRAENPLRGD